MALHFIDQKGSPGAGISSAERRLIRSHVMKGKNAGRPRRSMRRSTSVLYPVRRVLTWSAPGVAGTPAARPVQLLWSDLSLTSFPQQLDSESTKLMHRWFFDISDELFPPQFCSKFDIIKSIWVNCILQDEAYFHSTLAISASYVDFCQRKPSVSMKTLHHITKAYELVNVKLSGPESVSDSAIAAVIALVMYQQVHSQHSAGLVHLHGLSQMIQLRGGIRRLLEENRALALKALRVDVELSLQTGSQTVFRSGLNLPDAIRTGSEALIVLRKEAPDTIPTESSRLMYEVLEFSMVLDGVGQKGSSRLDPLHFMEMMIWLLFQLVHAARLGKSSSSLVQADPERRYEEVANLGMLAFMTTLLPEYGREADHSGYALLCHRLKNAIQKLHFASGPEENREFSSLLLWALFMGGVTVVKSKEMLELSPLVVETSRRLELWDWSDVKDQLCRFPWISALHSRPGLALWEVSQQMSSRTSRQAGLQYLAP